MPRLSSFAAYVALALAIVGTAAAQDIEARSDAQQDQSGPASTVEEGATSRDSGAATGRGQVVNFVEQQFDTVDLNRDGVLTANEFEPWMARLKAAETETAGKAADVTEAQTYASNAFTAADVDGNGNVSRDELTQFLSKA